MKKVIVHKLFRDGLVLLNCVSALIDFPIAQQWKCENLLSEKQ